MEFIYTIAFIKRGNQILMMNREKQPWQGMWNGIGGKRFNDETALDCIQREVAEETGILLNKDQLIDKGVVTWESDDLYRSGMHIYFVSLDDAFMYDTPIPTPEGLIDWKSIQWVASKENLGVAYNIPYFITHVINQSKRFQYQCFFDGNQLTEVKVEKIK